MCTNQLYDEVSIASFDCTGILGINTIQKSSSLKDKATSVDIALMEGNLMVTLIMLALHYVARIVLRP